MDNYYKTPIIVPSGGSMKLLKEGLHGSSSMKTLPYCKIILDKPRKMHRNNGVLIYDENNTRLP